MKGKETFLYFHPFSFFDTVSLLTELLQSEVKLHSMATEVKRTSAPKHVLSSHKSVSFLQTVLMKHCQFHYSSLLLSCKFWLDLHYILDMFLYLFPQPSGQNTLTCFLVYSFHFVEVRPAQVKIERREKSSVLSFFLFALSLKSLLLSTFTTS